MTNRLLPVLFGVLLALLWVPIFLSVCPVYKPNPLDGAYSNAPNVNFSWKGWEAGAYQSGKEQYNNDQFLWRPMMARFSHQIDYSLFQRAHVAILGKQEYLYDGGNIIGVTGKDYIGYEKMKSVLTKLKYIQDTLERMGKTVVFIHAPGKGFFYPEYLPDEDKKHLGAPTNYTTFLGLADSLGIHQLDFNSMFLRMKKSARGLLFSKQSAHWTVYGSTIAADSLITYIERVRHCRLPHQVYFGEEKSKQPRYTDNDLGKLINVSFPDYSQEYIYPKTYFKHDDSTTKPKMIFLSDSFIFQWIYDELPEGISSDWQDWYYFNEMNSKQWAHGDPNSPSVKQTDWIKALDNTDCLILLYTPHNLNDPGNGFIQRAFAHYFPNLKQD